MQAVWIYCSTKGNSNFTQECLTHFASQHTITEAVEIQYSHNGKPFLSGNAFYFSKSYTDSQVMIACSVEPVVIDCQEHRPINHERVQKRFFHPEEQAVLKENDWFYRIWCAKECIVKMTDGRLEELFPTFSVLSLLNNSHPKYFYYEPTIEEGTTVGILTSSPSKQICIKIKA